MSKGCNIGLDVVPNPTGTYPLNTSPNSEWYNGIPIHIVTWSGDKQCGIYRNQFNHTGKTCIAGSPYKHGVVIEYNPNTDINCPIDNNVILLAVVVGIYGFFKLRF